MYYLGIDNGGSMTKAALFDETGTLISVCSEKVELLHPQPGMEEVDGEQLWNSNVKAIRSVIEQSKINPSEIACVACAGHGNGMYLVDGDGAALVGIRSTDIRAREYVDQWERDGVVDALMDKTTQRTWAAQPNALLRWFDDNRPETLQKAKWMFMVKDFVRFKLTGEAYMELTDASATSLLNNQTAQWDDDLLQAWGVKKYRRLLPPLAQTTQICGRVTPAAAQETGLAVGTPVAGGMFDIDAVGLGVGMTNPTSLCLISGTWGNNQYIAPGPVVSKDIFMTTLYSIPGYYLMLEGSATSTSNLEWTLSTFFKGDKELLAVTNSGKTIYDVLNEELAATEPETSGAIFLPYLYVCPANPDGKGVLFGLDAWQNRGDVMRAVCEGIVFAHYWHIERLLKFRTKPGEILLAGGAAKSPIWRQMFADVFQTPVRVPDGSELGALGAAIAAAVAVGAFPDCQSACKTFVKFSSVNQPDASKADVYAKKYARFKKLLEVLNPSWSELLWK